MKAKTTIQKRVAKEMEDDAKLSEAAMEQLDMAALDRAAAAAREREEKREEQREILRVNLGREAKPVADLVPAVETDFAALFSGMKPRTADEMRAWSLKNEVLPRLVAWNFDKRFLREITDWNCDEQRDTFAVCAAKLRGVGAVVALIGIRGAGKTTIASQLALRCAWREHAAREAGEPSPVVTFAYRKMTALVQRFKPLYANFGAVNTESLMDSLARLCSYETLVIDELHDLSELAVREAMLIDIVDRRYAAELDTLLISNQTPEEWQAQTPDSIQSRINQHGIVLKCEWPSWRDKR